MRTQYTQPQLADSAEQPNPKKRRVCRLSAVVEFHVEPDIHNRYKTSTTNLVAAQALAVIADAVSSAEEMLHRHNVNVVAESGISTTITPEMVAAFRHHADISATVDSCMWTRRPLAFVIL